MYKFIEYFDKESICEILSERDIKSITKKHKIRKKATIFIVTCFIIIIFLELISTTYDTSLLDTVKEEGLFNAEYFRNGILLGIINLIFTFIAIIITVEGVARFIDSLVPKKNEKNIIELYEKYNNSEVKSL